jgi:hypothetical protein
MIVGSIVVRNPSRPTAEKEVAQLRAATDIYSKIARKTRGGRYGQVISYPTSHIKILAQKIFR